jgi:hypothetical protein
VIERVLGLSCLLGAVLGVPAFGAETPYMTRAQLQKLSLVSVADPKGADNALVFPDVHTGIYLPQEEIAAGEPVPAWLIVRSVARDPQRGIPAGFDLGVSGEKPRVEGTARLQLARLKDGGGEEIIADLKDKVGRATKRVLLPGEGYLVNTGDVRNLSEKPLTPGQYRLRFWAEGQRSESTFRIVARAGTMAASTGPGRSELAGLAEHDAGVLHWIGAFQGRPQAKGGNMHWPLRNGYLAPRSLEDFRLGIAMGIGNLPESRYYARLQDIPAHDDAVAITAKFAPGSMSKLQITLTPVSRTTQPANATAPATGAANSGDVMLPAYPAIYLLVESLERPTGVRINSERQGGPNSMANRFNVPYIIDAQLPPDWTSRLNFSGKARLTVFFASEPIRGGMENDAEGFDQAIPAQFNRGNRVTGHRWSGIVRAAPLEFEIKRAGRDDDGN